MDLGKPVPLHSGQVCSLILGVMLILSNRLAVCKTGNVLAISGPTEWDRHLNAQAPTYSPAGSSSTKLCSITAGIFATDINERAI